MFFSLEWPSVETNCHEPLQQDTSLAIVYFSNIMQALYLGNNGLKSLPSNLFKMCVQLSTLDLHGTEITMDLLRQVHLTSYLQVLFQMILFVITSMS